GALGGFGGFLLGARGLGRLVDGIPGLGHGDCSLVCACVPVRGTVGRGLCGNGWVLALVGVVPGEALGVRSTACDPARRRAVRQSDVRGARGNGWPTRLVLSRG